MSLKELLARKIGTQSQASPAPAPKPEIKEELSYILRDRITVDVEKFLAAWSIRIANPYMDNSIGRDLVRFLTDDNYYVLNTFMPLDIKQIMDIYLSLYPPRIPKDLHNLWLLLADLQLYVPSTYQNMIEDIIHKKFPLTKNPDCGKI